MKRKYYLIDTENVGDSWLDLTAKLKQKDRAIAFYTQNHSKRLEEFLLWQVNNPRIVWLECAVGNNALDLQLIGVLAYLIAKHPRAVFCIYSNDKGFQRTVEFWQDRGIQISQKSPNLKKKTKKKDKKKKAAVSACGYGVLTGPLTQEQYAEEIARCVSFSNLNGWYCALTVILGQEDGREWYQKVRRDCQLRERLSRLFAGDRHERALSLTALALFAHGLDDTKAEAVYQVIRTNKYQDLNEIKMGLDKLTGQKSPNPYYTVMRPLVSLLKDL